MASSTALVPKNVPIWQAKITLTNFEIIAHDVSRQKALQTAAAPGFTEGRTCNLVRTVTF